MPFSVRPIHKPNMKVRLRIVKKTVVGFYEICHISVNTSLTDLRQVSKFSLVQYLKLFLRHPKDLVSRKNVLGEEKIFFFISLYIGYGLKMGLRENGITQWLWVLQTWDRCQNFPWFHPQNFFFDTQIIQWLEKMFWKEKAF